MLCAGAACKPSQSPEPCCKVPNDTWPPSVDDDDDDDDEAEDEEEEEEEEDNDDDDDDDSYQLLGCVQSHF